MKTPTRVLQVGLDWFEDKPGGLSRYYAEALTATRNIFETRGLVLGSSDLGKRTGGTVQAFASPTDGLARRFAASRSAVAREVRVFQPDLVVSHFAPHIVAALDTLRGTPLLTHFQGPWAAESRAEGDNAARSLMKWSIEKIAYGSSSHLVVLSEAFKTLLHETYGVPRERIHVLPGGVNVSDFAVRIGRDEAKARLGLRPDRDYIFCVRRLVRRMGIETLIDAMSRISAAHPETGLLIGGGGALREELEARVRQAGLTENVSFLGRVSGPDLPFYFRASILSVVPTISLEGFGLTVLESLAAGTPVITTPIGGLRETMMRFRPDLLTETAGTEAIAGLLDRVLTHRELLPTQAECEAFAATHDWSVIGQRLAEIYQHAAASGSTGRLSRVHAAEPLPSATPSAAARAAPTLSVAVVSYRRCTDLARCMASLRAQSAPLLDVTVVHRRDDAETAALIEREKRSGPLSVRSHVVDRPGVVAARNLALDTAQADIVAMIDDDTEPPPDWAGRLIGHYANDPRLGGLGGRDVVYVEGRPIDGRRDVVGKLQWFGRVIGNHHLGHGPVREVDILKGANMSFRMDAVRTIRFNEVLRGDGAQSWEDAAFTLAIKRAGWSVRYDPDLSVRHNQSGRAEARHYAGVEAISGRERYNYRCFCFNEVIAVWPSLSVGGRIAYLLYSVLIGTRVSPGLAQAVRFARALGFASFDRFLVCQAGKLDALRVLAMREGRSGSIRATER